MSLFAVIMGYASSLWQVNLQNSIDHDQLHVAIVSKTSVPKIWPKQNYPIHMCAVTAFVIVYT